jgi:hypothetical protein
MTMTAQTPSHHVGDDLPVTKIKLPSPLSSFPSSIFTHASTLTHLDLSGTGLCSLPSSISLLQHLKIAFFSSCNFATYPSELSSCPALEMVAFRGSGMTSIPESAFQPGTRLRWLILTGNRIETLPRSIGNCGRLEKCMLSGNRLKVLPEEMNRCTELGLLRLSANEMERLPGWLLEMPKLAFLSFAGNPCAQEAAMNGGANSELAKVAWKDIEVHHLLGEGASGVIHKGLWKTPPHGQQQQIAIKLFKGAVTSDGTPLDEMRACIRAGSHPNLIDPLGEIQDHPQRKKGLLMQLIPPSYHTLGLPPSLDSCTRDCFAPTTRLTLHQGLEILRSIASAAAHLHAHGVAHGDLYAHNILFCDDGHALLGDFGAASLYDSRSYVASVQRLEVLAFAHLVEDIWSLIELRFSEAELRSSVQLEALHRKCASRITSERPAFVDVVRELEGIHEPVKSAMRQGLGKKGLGMVAVRA